MKNKILLLLASCLAMAFPVFLSAQSGSTSASQNPAEAGATQNSTQDSNTPSSTQDANSTSNQTGTPPSDREAGSMATQNPDQDSSQVQPAQTPYTYKVSVTQRSTQAVDYRDRGGATQVDFKGTPLMSKVDGRAKVTGHTGRMAIDATFHHLLPARNFGPEYLTYVLWAISPEGRPQNLGEVVPNDNGDAAVQLTTALQEFGLILTAEPYFAVTRPSDLLVAENVIRPDTAGGIHPITARYELLQKGQYTVNINPLQLPATSVDKQKNTPLQVLEAENAIAIAEATGAAKYAPETLQKAKDYLSQAQEYHRRKQGKTAIGTVARAAAQSAEDARLITFEKKHQEQVATERRKTQERIQQAQTQAEREAARAEDARREAQREADQRALAQQERMSAEQARLAAQQQAKEAEAARQAALQQQQAAAQQAEQARLQAQQAEQARLQTEQKAEQQRQQLLQQLNQVLQTKDTAKGLIVNVSDVLFDTGQATLKPGAKVKLAKVAGIILAYPDLRLDVGGHTDSTGTHAFNQRLSERRADAVRDFLIDQGVSPSNVGSQGYAEADPIASNATAAGRQLNRRVELVVSGTAIGQNVGAGGVGGASTPATGASATGAGGVSGTVAAPAATTTSPASTAPATGAIPSTVASPQPAGTGVTNSGTQVSSPMPSGSSTPTTGTPTTPSPTTVSPPGSTTGTGMQPGTTTTPGAATTPPPPSSTGQQPPPR
jgi:outer membrane protein OmpA-like peptidoglycan-associated protein